jgi:hypothetical protein
MTRRLLWKELREQGPFALAALLAPAPILLFAHLVLKDPGLLSTLFLLWVPYAIFAGWGATRMPRERESGRLTLGALPAPWWQVLPLKAFPAIVWAVCLVFAYGYGYGHIYAAAEGGDVEITPSQMWPPAGLVALGYSSALLAGLFWQTAISTVAGLLAGAAGYWLLDSGMDGPDLWATIAVWALVAALVVAAACVVMARSRGARPRRIGVVAASPLVVAAAVLLARSVGALSEEAQDWYLGIAVWAPEVQSGNLVAKVENAKGKGATRSYRIIASDLDGRDLGVLKRQGLPVSLAWTSQGDLVFREVTQATRQDSLVLWSPTTGGLRVVTQRVAEMPRLGWFLGGYEEIAVEPNGERVALIYPRRVSRLSRAENQELWVVDLRTGAQRLLYPDVDAGKLWWRRGRVYMQQGWTNRLWSSSPDRGGLRREFSLPPASEDPSK